MSEDELLFSEDELDLSLSMISLSVGTMLEIVVWIKPALMLASTFDIPFSVL